MLRVFHYFCHVLAQLTRWHEALSLSFPGALGNESVKLEEFTPRAWIETLKILEESPFFRELLQKVLRSGVCNSREDLSLICYESFHRCQEAGGSLITLEDPLYPRLLKEAPERPLCLFVLGNSSLLKAEMIAIVGSRKASHYALEKSYEFAHALSLSGKTVVSGGAYGCDALAHKGALSSGAGRTLAVLSGGLQSLYPKGNQALFSSIQEEGGALVSERLWHQASRPYDFPIRNRIISGLCKATLIMDASVKSGTLVTAYKALDQGRNVYTLSFPEGRGDSSGVELLKEQGAESFCTKEELFRLLEESHV